MAVESVNEKYKGSLNFTVKKYSSPCQSQDSVVKAVEAYYTFGIHAFIGPGKTGEQAGKRFQRLDRIQDSDYACIWLQSSGSGNPTGRESKHISTRNICNLIKRVGNSTDWEGNQTNGEDNQELHLLVCTISSSMHNESSTALKQKRIRFFLLQSLLRFHRCWSGV